MYLNSNLITVFFDFQQYVSRKNVHYSRQKKANGLNAHVYIDPVLNAHAYIVWVLKFNVYIEYGRVSQTFHFAVTHIFIH